MLERKCCICKGVKPIDAFGKDRAQPLGYQHECKPCKAVKKLTDRRTRKGLAARIIQAQRQRVKRGQVPPLTYTLIEFRDWLFQQPTFEELYINWVKSDYTKELRPTTDRIDDWKGYTFDNMRLATLTENLCKPRPRGQKPRTSELPN